MSFFDGGLSNPLFHNFVMASNELDLPESKLFIWEVKTVYAHDPVIGMKDAKISVPGEISLNESLQQ
jgi:hypothetical protein